MCEHMYVGNSKNKMLSFLFLESDFSNRRLLLHYTKSQYNSPISDEENIYMTNSIRAYRKADRGVSKVLICGSLLGGLSPTKQE